MSSNHLPQLSNRPRLILRRHAIALLLVSASLAPLPASGLRQVGLDDAQLSVTGAAEDPSFDALSPTAAFDSTHQRVLVCWASNRIGDDEWEIVCDLLDAQGATLRDDFEVSFFGPTAPTIRELYDALRPAAAFDPQNDEYLVCWQGDTSEASHVDGELEIWCRRLDANGDPVGIIFEVSQQGPLGDPDFDAILPAVAHDPVNGGFVVCWSGDDAVPGELVDEESEIWCRPVGDPGAMGTRQRISHAGPDADAGFGAFYPRVAVWPEPVSGAAQAAVCWSADDDTADHVQSEFEILCRRLDPLSATPAGPTQRISTQGGIANPAFDALRPSLAIDPASGDLAVCWEGSFDTARLEIYCTTRDASLAPITPATRVSFVVANGQSFNTAIEATIIRSRGLWLVCWSEYHEVWAADVACQTLSPGLAPVAEPTLRVSAVDAFDLELWIARAWSPLLVDLGPDATYDQTYVVWTADPIGRGLVDDEHEIFLQRLQLHDVFGDGFETGDLGSWSASAP